MDVLIGKMMTKHMISRLFPWFSDILHHFAIFHTGGFSRQLHPFTAWLMSMATCKRSHLDGKNGGWALGGHALINEAAGHGSKSAGFVVCIPLKKWGDSQYGQYHGQFYSDFNGEIEVMNPGTLILDWYRSNQIDLALRILILVFLDFWEQEEWRGESWWEWQGNTSLAKHPWSSLTYAAKAKTC